LEYDADKTKMRTPKGGKKETEKPKQHRAVYKRVLFVCRE